jgi:hypothetical protein
VRQHDSPAAFVPCHRFFTLSMIGSKPEPQIRPSKNLEMWRALPSIVEDAEKDENVRVIVLRGAAGHFGAGNDIEEFRRASADKRSAEE